MSRWAIEPSGDRAPHCGPDGKDWSWELAPQQWIEWTRHSPGDVDEAVARLLASAAAGARLVFLDDTNRLGMLPAVIAWPAPEPSSPSRARCLSATAAPSGP